MRYSQFCIKDLIQPYGIKIYKANFLLILKNSLKIYLLQFQEMFLAFYKKNSIESIMKIKKKIMTKVRKKKQYLSRKKI